MANVNQLTKRAIEQTSEVLHVRDDVEGKKTFRRQFIDARVTRDGKFMSVTSHKRAGNKKINSKYAVVVIPQGGRRFNVISCGEEITALKSRNQHSLTSKLGFDLNSTSSQRCFSAGFRY